MFSLCETPEQKEAKQNKQIATIERELEASERETEKLFSELQITCEQVRETLSNLDTFDECSKKKITEELARYQERLDAIGGM